MCCSPRGLVQWWRDEAHSKVLPSTKSATHPVFWHDGVSSFKLITEQDGSKEFNSYLLLEEGIERMWLPFDMWTGPRHLKALHSYPCATPECTLCPLLTQPEPFRDADLREQCVWSRPSWPSMRRPLYKLCISRCGELLILQSLKTNLLCKFPCLFFLVDKFYLKIYPNILDWVLIIFFLFFILISEETTQFVTLLLATTRNKSCRLSFFKQFLVRYFKYLLEKSTSEVTVILLLLLLLFLKSCFFWLLWHRCPDCLLFHSPWSSPEETAQNWWHPCFHLVYRVVTLSAKSLQLCLTLGNTMDCSLPGSSVHGILQARILDGVAISYSRGSFQPRDQTHIS